MLDIIRGPHYQFSGQYSPAASYTLLALEDLVPGCLVYAYKSDGKRIRLKNHVEGSLRRFWIVVGVTGGFLVDYHLDAAGLDFEVEGRGGVESVRAITPKYLAEMKEVGRGILERKRADGELTGNIVKDPYDWQASLVGMATERNYLLAIWPTGTGKTAGAIAAAATYVENHGGDIIVACPGGARPVWMIELPETIAWRPYILKPESSQRKKDESLENYIADCRREGRPAIVVAGHENVGGHLATIKELLRPSVVIFDEIHKLGSHARWTPVYGRDGSVTYEPKETKGGETNQAVNVMRLSELPSVKFRLGLSATPLGEGRPRRLWSQLDLLARGSFAYSYWSFVKRYCGGGPTEFGGGIDDKGQTHSDELKRRLAYLVHQVPYEVTRKKMKPFTVKVIRLPKELQLAPERFDENHTFNQAIREAEKEEIGGGLVRGRSVEYKLMEAASRKRGWVCDQAVEALRGGGKVVIFTGRRKEVEVWQERIMRQVSRGDDQTGGVRSFGYHGGCSDSQKVEIIEAFKYGKGPLLLVATGQSMGTSIDGLQAADLAILAMCPWTADEFIQQRGRFDRGGSFAVPTTLLIPLAEGTYDERVAQVISEKFGNIEELFQADEIEGLATRMTGSDNQQASLANMLSWLTGED